MVTVLYKDPLNIIICGVGGQGNILASELIASALVEKGYYATIGETYGASQRGGSVMSHIRVSTRTQYGPLIPLHEADIIIGFEPIETLRIARDFAHHNTRVIFDSRPNYPLGVLSGEAVYPDITVIEKELAQLCHNVQIIEATRIAIEAGTPQAANIVLMGALTGLNAFPLTEDEFAQILKQRFTGDIYQLNRQIFTHGFQAVLETRPDYD